MKSSARIAILSLLLVLVIPSVVFASAANDGTYYLQVENTSPAGSAPGSQPNDATYYIKSSTLGNVGSVSTLTSTDYGLTSGYQQTVLLTPATPTIGTATVLSTTSIRWGFTDKASNEIGFKVYDGSNVLKATCATASLTYCDETGLSANTTYTRKVVAYNASGNSAYSSTATKYTLAAVPSAPTVAAASTTSVTVTVNVNSNPAATEFAIQETGGNYVQADGTLGVSAVWQTYATWGSGSGVTVTGLAGGTTYTFQVKARNGDNTATAFGSTGNAATNVSAPTIGTPSVLSTTSIRWNFTARFY